LSIHFWCIWSIFWCIWSIFCVAYWWGHWS